LPKFADERIKVEYIQEGKADDKLVKAALELIDVRKRRRFYIGATSHPEARIQSHRRSSDYKRMMYRTESYRDARRFESLLLNSVFSSPGCQNRKNGSWGLKEWKPVFYVYMLD
jgi:hypothetical protein